MNLYHIKLTDNQKYALERLFNMGIVWNKTELSEAWEQLREQVLEASCTVAIKNALQDAECNCKKPTETAPQCATFRLFRKGDKVQVIKRDGRCNGKDGEYLREAFCTVAEDETRNELVRVLHNATEYRLDPAYLVLVTPVEEPEPYSARGSIDGCILYKSGEYYGEFVNRIETERVCKLLNAAHRKEQSND